MEKLKCSGCNLKTSGRKTLHSQFLPKLEGKVDNHTVKPVDGLHNTLDLSVIEKK